MDTTLAILMALGIFVVGPALIGLAILGVAILSGRRELKARQAEAVKEAAKALAEAKAAKEKPVKVT